MDSSKKLNRILICMMLYAFITLLNQTSINTALTTIRHQFSISTSSVQWMSTIYLLVMGVMVPVTAYLSTRFNIKDLFIVSLIIFIIGMLVSGLAPNFGILILGRVIQAVGGGISAPLLQTVIFILAPLNKRGSLMGLVGLVIGVAPALGPSISGYLVSNFDWHTIFLIYVPILIINLLISIFYMPKVNEPDKNEHLDIPSVILSSITFGSLLYGASAVGEKGFTSPIVLCSFLVGIVVFVIFYKKQMKMERPLLNFHVFDYKVFRLAVVLIIISNIALLSVALLLPIYLQEIHGFSAFQAGLILLPGALISAFMSVVTGRLFDRYGAKWITVFGFIIMSLATYILATLEVNATAIFIIIIYAVRCFAISMVFMPPQTAGMNELPRLLVGHGSAMLNTIRTIAGSVGIAVLVSIMTYFSKNYTADTKKYSGLENIKTQALDYGYMIAMLVATFIAVIGIFLAFRLPTKEKIKK